MHTFILNKFGRIWFSWVNTVYVLYLCYTSREATKITESESVEFNCFYLKKIKPNNSFDIFY